MTNMTKDEIKALQIKAAEICEFLELRAGSYIIPKPEFDFPRHDDPEICYAEADIAKKYQEQFESEAGFDIAEIAKQFKELFSEFTQER